ncbi:hypothetical protein KBT16_30190 [Nostoc sp. CCCryo 231-06]|nr:hypothetical protein [Nostoc sp. CCCryo 231-06]
MPLPQYKIASLYQVWSFYLNKKFVTPVTLTGYNFQPIKIKKTDLSFCDTKNKSRDGILFLLLSGIQLSLQGCQTAMTTD